MLALAKKSRMTIANNAAKAAEGLSRGFLSRRDSTIVAKAQSAWNHEENSPVPAGRLINICGTDQGTDHDFGRPSGTGTFLHRNPGTSCLATIRPSLRDKSRSPIEAPHNYLSAYGVETPSPP
jgi:hypothetical protein